ncbi:MAG: DMT family transporter [Limisphaerales bacterium]|nr:EamA family transporter [Verrucomicrobiota bacterium]
MLGYFYLISATILFSFSFGLIKQQVTTLPSDAVSFLRLALAALVFSPFLRRVNVKKHFCALCIGAIQFGLMYILFIRAFHYLQGSEVALLTTTTPMWVALLFSYFSKSIRYQYFTCAALSMCGALLIVWNPAAINASLTGILLVQGANVCFALGQVFWKQYLGANSNAVMASAYLGAALIALPFALVTTDWSSFSPTPFQWAALLYLGCIPTALGFWLWNKGAVEVGPSALAVMNDLKIPMSVFLALILFQETVANPLRFSIGSILIITAIYLGRRVDKKIS